MILIYIKMIKSHATTERGTKLNYNQFKAAEINSELQNLKEKYNSLKSLNLKLDMSRGKPNSQQLDLSNELLNLITKENVKTADGIETRNYGGVDGITEMKQIFADLFETKPENVIVGDNSSLHLMFDVIAQAMSTGLGGEKPWTLQGKVKFLCPSPGYDRHFALTEYFGIENILVPMTENGPNMDLVEQLVKDPSVKGIWCVPKYSNPDGISYSDETVIRMASLKPAAKDFRIMWDNAYVVHHLYDDRQDKILNLLDECKKQNSENIVLSFMSTSKITFPGSGVCAMCASLENIELIRKRMSFQTIGPNKINQLRHVKFLKSAENIDLIMKKHAAFIRPKFEVVINELKNQLKPYGVGSWTNPNGGYFISYYAPTGCAKRIVELCKQAGLILTPAGAAFPGGFDRDDSNIRIAPTFPSIDELKKAMKIFTISAKIAYLEKLLLNLSR